MVKKQQKGKLVNADFLLSKLSDRRLAEMSVVVDFLLEDPENHELLEGLLEDTDIIIADFQNKRPLTGFQTRAPFARIKTPIAAKKAAWDNSSITLFFESTVFPKKSFMMDLDFRLRLLGCMEVESIYQAYFKNKERVKTRLFVQNITSDGSREDIYSVDLIVTRKALIKIAADATDGSSEEIADFFEKAIS